MIFVLDKHGHLNITSTGDIALVSGEDDTIVLTQDETDEVRQVLGVVPAPEESERPSPWARRFFRLRGDRK